MFAAQLEDTEEYYSTSVSPGSPEFLPGLETTAVSIASNNTEYRADCNAWTQIIVSIGNGDPHQNYLNTQLSVSNPCLLLPLDLNLTFKHSYPSSAAPQIPVPSAAKTQNPTASATSGAALSVVGDPVDSPSTRARRLETHIRALATPARHCVFGRIPRILRTVSRLCNAIRVMRISMVRDMCWSVRTRIMWEASFIVLWALVGIRGIIGWIEMDGREDLDWFQDVAVFGTEGLAVFKVSFQGDSRRKGYLVGFSFIFNTRILRTQLIKTNVFGFRCGGF